MHRKHHAFTDEEGDPHSPLLMGFWSVQLGNVFHYVRAAKNKQVVERYARDMQDDVWDRMLFNHGVLGLIDAAHRFDEGRGIKFETFAERRVRAMNDAAELEPHATIEAAAPAPVINTNVSAT